MSSLPQNIFRCLAALPPSSLLPLKGCKQAPPPPVAGVSIALRYPVILIGQRTFDVRGSEAALINVPGASGLSLFERVWSDDPEASAKAVAKVRSLDSVEELIAACGEYWSWTR